MPGKHGFGDTRKKSSQSPAYKKQKFGVAASPFTMKGPKDLVDVFSLIPGSKYVKKAFRNVKEKIHKSDFAQKHLIVDPKKTKLTKVGEFIKKHTE